MAILPPEVSDSDKTSCLGPSASPELVMIRSLQGARNELETQLVEAHRSARAERARHDQATKIAVDDALRVAQAKYLVEVAGLKASYLYDKVLLLGAISAGEVIGAVHVATEVVASKAELAAMLGGLFAIVAVAHSVKEAVLGLIQSSRKKSEPVRRTIARERLKRMQLRPSLEMVPVRERTPPFALSQ